MRHLDTLPDWQRRLAQPIWKAIYDAAVGMTDDEIQAVVDDTLRTARRHLSS